MKRTDRERRKRIPEVGRLPAARKETRLVQANSSWRSILPLLPLLPHPPPPPPAGSTIVTADGCIQRVGYSLVSRLNPSVTRGCLDPRASLENPEDREVQTDLRLVNTDADLDKAGSSTRLLYSKVGLCGNVAARFGG